MLLSSTFAHYERVKAGNLGGERSVGSHLTVMRLTLYFYHALIDSLCPIRRLGFRDR